MWMGVSSVKNRSGLSNNYGPYHFPEKLIPLMIANALADKPLPVYGKGENVRDWLYVEDHCKAIDLIIHNGKVGEVYNVGGHNEMKNIDIVKLICKELGKPESACQCIGIRCGFIVRIAAFCIIFCKFIYFCIICCISSFFRFRSRGFRLGGRCFFRAAAGCQCGSSEHCHRSQPC